MIETLCWLSGILGAFFFAINLAPQIVKCYRTKSCGGISRMFLVFAFCGNIFSAIFVLYTNLKTGLWQYPIYFNYGVATFLTAVLTVMKVRYSLRSAHVRNTIPIMGYIGSLEYLYDEAA
jgi:uncharacterized protein with PQ loop repeat